MAVLLQVKNATKSYGNQVLLDDAEVTLVDDVKVGFVGRNGAGKSTLLRVLLGEEELERGEVTHAMRFTIQNSRRAYVYPATHHASSKTNVNLPRMGERFRLRQDFDVTGFSPHTKALLNGLKKHGMFVADNGGDWRISVAPDSRIKGLDELRRVKGRDFEVIQPTGER